MKDIMLADTPVEQRAQILRDSCDQIVERSYTRKFDQEEINERRADLANVAIQKADLETIISGNQSRLQRQNQAFGGTHS